MMNETFMGIPLQLSHAVSVESGVIMGGSSMKDGIIPQWGYQETKDLICVRAEFEKDAVHSRRNKILWETVSSKMREKGHRKSAEQCKCEWTNLVNRYKGKELSEQDNDRPAPFYDELRAFFTEHVKNKDKTGTKSKKKIQKGLAGERSSEDFSEEVEEQDEESGDERLMKGKNRKTDRDRQRVTAEKCRANSIQEVLEDFFYQQQRVELQWREAVERREQERRLQEQQWRDAMNKLENERLMREQMWREREEQRRAREEARAEKRDALFTALLARLASEGL